MEPDTWNPIAIAYCSVVQYNVSHPTNTPNATYAPTPDYTLAYSLIRWFEFV